MKKILLMLGIGLVVLLVLIGIVVGFYIGPIVKIGMEEMGPKITKVSIKVDSVDMLLFMGSVKLNGLQVGNPDGYKAPQSISVGTVAVSVDPFSVLSNKIIVHSVHVESPEITFEGGLSGNNLSKLMNNVNSTGPTGGQSASSNSASTTSNKPAPKIEVDDFLITGAKVHVILTTFGSKQMTIPLPDIHLTDLGKDSNGLTPAELTSAVLGAISSDTIKAVTSSVANLGQGVLGIGKSATATAGNSISSITKGIGGLFGK